MTPILACARRDSTASFRSGATLRHSRMPGSCRAWYGGVSDFSGRHRHVAGPPSDGLVQDRAPDRARADGRRDGCRSGDRSVRGGRAWLAAGCAMLNEQQMREQVAKIRAAPKSRSTSISSVTRRPRSTTRARRAGATGSSLTTKSSASIQRRRCRRAIARRSTLHSARRSRRLKPEVVSFHFGLPEPLAQARQGRGLRGDQFRDHGGGGALARSSAASMR